MEQPQDDLKGIPRKLVPLLCKMRACIETLSTTKQVPLFSKRLSALDKKHRKHKNWNRNCKILLNPIQKPSGKSVSETLKKATGKP